MLSTEMRFTPLEPSIYASSSTEEVWQRYIEALRIDDSSIYNAVYANKLEELHNMLAPEKMSELKEEFHILRQQLHKWAQHYGVDVVLKGRQKDFVGINKKIRLFFQTRYPLDKLLDVFGFRVILCTEQKDSPFTVKLCYEMMNSIIEFFVTKSRCIPLEAEPVFDTGFDPEKFKEAGIVIPKERLINPVFENNVKDYAVNPKDNGYQSLHVIFKKPHGLIFELQVRTTGMDIVAEYGSASHTAYKLDRYKETGIDIDFSKVNMPGFALLPDGTIYDRIGLCKPVDLFGLL